MPTIPSWIKAARPAEFEAEGLRIGDSEAAQGAEQQARAEAGQRAQQELAIRQRQLEAEATRASQKYQAQQQYSQFVSSGGDPLQAILKFGPLMGQSTDVAAAVRAQPKAPMAAPTIQMQTGPDGTQIPILVQGNKATVIPASAYRDRPQPEQWTDTTQQINGQDIPGQKSTRSGRFIPYPAGEQAGAVTPQKRLEISLASNKKKQLEKTLADETQLLALAKKRAGGKTPKHADLEAVEADLQKQIDELDAKMEDTASGGKATGSAKTLQFIRDKSGKLVLSSDNADQSGN